MNGIITGTGSCVPESVMTNHDIEKLVDTSDEWIKERTGIRERRIARTESAAEMAAKAAERALENASASAQEVDLIIVATISSDMNLPCTACEVQRLIRADNAACFDVNAACTGFIAAYNIAEAYIASGISRCALVIGSETLSRITDWSDRGTCILFGDGAGAALLRCREGSGYIPIMHSEGEKGDALTCSSGTEGRLRMDGQGVFTFAVRNVPEVIREVLEKNGLKPEDIEYYIVHQANRRIIEAAARRLGEPIEKFPMNLEYFGNTSSASVPLLLDELNRKGAMKYGGRYVFVGFGGGLTWGASVFEWKTE